MSENSPTGAADDQVVDDTIVTPADPNATTDTQTADDAAKSTTGDDLDTSKSTDDKPADGDKPAEGVKADDKAPASPTFDTDLDDWAEKTGRKKPENDEERALLQEVRDGRREHTKSQQQAESKKNAKELDKTIQDIKPAPVEGDDDYVDPLERKQAELEATIKQERTLRIQSEYFGENSVTTEEAKAMGDFLKEKVEKAVTPEAKRAALDFWTDPSNLEDWHILAKAKIGSQPADTSKVEKEAALKERERIEKENKATGPTRSAQSVKSTDKTEDEERLERFSNW